MAKQFYCPSCMTHMVSTEGTLCDECRQLGVNAGGWGGNPFDGASNPFGNGCTSSSGDDNLFGAGIDPFDRNRNPFDMSGVPIDGNCNPFNAGSDPFNVGGHRATILSAAFPAILSTKMFLQKATTD